MGNPARELAELLSVWREVPARQTVRTVRGFDASDLEASWRKQVDAVRLLSDVDRFLIAMDRGGIDVSHYRRAYPWWAHMVFAPDISWNDGSASTREVGQASAVDLLRALADLIDLSEIAVSIPPARQLSSVEALDEVVEYLSRPEVTLTQVERRYVFELLTSCRTVLQESTALGTVDLISRVHELIGVMTMLAETLAAQPETRTLGKKLLAAAKRVAPYASFGARVSAGSIGAVADLLQITGG